MNFNQNGILSIPVYSTNVGTTLLDVNETGVDHIYRSSGTSLGGASTDNSKDVTAQDGADTITIAYLDASGVVQTGTRTMNGTTRVTTSFSDLVHTLSAYASVVGADGINAGAITFDDGASGDEFEIPAGRNAWAPGRHVVPAGKKSSVSVINLFCPDAVLFDIELWADINLYDNSLNSGVFVPIGSTRMQRHLSWRPAQGIVFPAGVTVKLRASTTAASQTLKGDMNFEVQAA